MFLLSLVRDLALVFAFTPVALAFALASVFALTPALALASALAILRLWRLLLHLLVPGLAFALIPALALALPLALTAALAPQKALHN